MHVLPSNMNDISEDVALLSATINEAKRKGENPTERLSVQQLFDGNTEGNLTPKTGSAVVKYFQNLFPNIFKSEGDIKRKKQRITDDRYRVAIQSHIAHLLAVCWELESEGNFIEDGQFKSLLLLKDFNKLKVYERIIVILGRYLEQRKVQPTPDDYPLLRESLESPSSGGSIADLSDTRDRLDDLEEIVALQHLKISALEEQVAHNDLDFEPTKVVNPQIRTLSPSSGISGTDILEILHRFTVPVTVLDIRRLFPPPLPSVSGLTNELYAYELSGIVRRYDPSGKSKKPRWLLMRS